MNRIALWYLKKKIDRTYKREGTSAQYIALHKKLRKIEPLDGKKTTLEWNEDYHESLCSFK
jgi:hypothetical protein